ncbi:MAG: helix-turn-helix domain-containing protein [Clostridiales bacterium]|nr:helix-turn-helix domain-containing protein [Candidatus Cacconaster stercorequi]
MTNHNNNPVYKTLDDLPMSLNANDIAAVLCISRTSAYALMHARDFPSLTVGKRMIVLKEKFIAWMDEQTMRKEWQL